MSRSDLAGLLERGRIEETIYFAADEKARLTYVLEHSAEARGARLQYRFPEVAVILSTAEAKRWGESDEIGIYATVALDADKSIDLIVEKDFACLDLSEEENADTFPHPHNDAVC